MRDNICIQVGRLVSMDDIRTTNTGKKVLNIRVAVETGRRGANGTPRASFFTYTIWERQAEWVAANIMQGDEVVIQSTPVQETWTDRNSGEQRQRVTFTVESIKLGMPALKNMEAHMNRKLDNRRRYNSQEDNSQRRGSAQTRRVGGFRSSGRFQVQDQASSQQELALQQQGQRQGPPAGTNDGFVDDDFEHEDLPF